MKPTIQSLLLVIAMIASPSWAAEPAVPPAADQPAKVDAEPGTGPAAAPADKVAEEPAVDPLEEARKTLKADRQEVVAAALHLTDAEANDFWPIYHQYRAAMDLVGDRLVDLIEDYAEAGSHLSEDDARQLLRDYLSLEKKYLDTRAKYFKKVSEVLPATKTLRFAQIENRMDLAIRLQLAAQIPLAAGEKGGGAKTPLTTKPAK